MSDKSPENEYQIICYFYFHYTHTHTLKRKAKLEIFIRDHNL